MQSSADVKHSKNESAVKVEFQVPGLLYAEIESVIKTAAYRDWQHFLETSVRNQLTLESTRAAKDAILLGDQIVQVKFPNYRELGRTWDKTRLHLRSACDPQSLRSPHMPFCNRIFPAKVATRVLCNLLEDQDGMTMHLFGDTLGMIAFDLGRYLQALDKAKQRGARLEAMCTAFPVRKRDIQASKRRFLQHFVGALDSSGTASGMAVTLGFVAIDSSGQIGITEAGDAFARIENPIIDHQSVDRMESDLSKSEINMYLRVLEERLPQEAQAMNTLKEIVKKGTRSYTDICSKFREAFVPLGIDSKSLVSPLLSRMRELLLIKVESEGLKTYYDIL